MAEIERSAERDAAVTAALAHVPMDGWSSRALRAGMADAGLDPRDLELLFPGGPAEAIEVWCDLADRRMADEMSAIEPGTMKLRARVAHAVMGRLTALQGNKEAVGRALALLALPGNAAVAARTGFRTVDAIWRSVGDRSADFSWYTKRASLGAIYTATLLYWLNDESEESERTAAFLDRRIDGLMVIPKARARLKAVRERLGERLPNPLAMFARLRRAG